MDEAILRFRREARHELGDRQGAERLTAGPSASPRRAAPPFWAAFVADDRHRRCDASRAGRARVLAQKLAVFGSRRRTKRSFHCTSTRRPIQPGGVP